MRHKLLQIANELNKHILHSDEEVSCQFSKLDNGHIFLRFIHFSERYEVDIDSVNFFESDDEQKLNEKFELAKDVISGECLVDETDSHLLNQA